MTDNRLARSHDAAPPTVASLRWPGRRRLQTFAFDPMTTRLSGRRLEVDVLFEENLEPGPVGALVEVRDYDAANDVWYSPVDLNDPRVLARGGLRPSEMDPLTHQQVVYAVAMSVIERFERFLGRRFRWRADERLLLVPHAFEGRNAFFDPVRRAVLFGHFKAEGDNPGANLPGQRIFTCLSNDIVAHEVTHAIIHRLRPHYSEVTNPDVLAFHEAAADLMALFLHFVYPDVVVEVIGTGRGDLLEGNALFDLAEEFGKATGRGAALRTAIKSRDDSTIPRELPAEPHERGAVFVAAVFDAFHDAYRSQIADLLRIATGGSGVLPPGNLHPDLVFRVAREAVKNAERILGMVIRAFDYLPVVDVEFGDVVRAVVTADLALHPDDALQLRARLVESLRRRGIRPQATSLADDALAWPRPMVDLRLGDDDHPVDLEALLGSATRDLDPKGDPGSARRGERTSEASENDGAADETDQAADASRAGPETDPVGRTFARQVARWARAHAIELGLSPGRPVAVAGFHVSYCIADDDQPRPVIVVQLHQRRTDLEDTAPAGDAPGSLTTPLRAGTTLVVGVDAKVHYVIAKPLPLDPDEVAAGPDPLAVAGRQFHQAGEERLARIRKAHLEMTDADPLATWLPEPVVARLTLAHVHTAIGLVDH